MEKIKTILNEYISIDTVARMLARFGESSRRREETIARIWTQYRKNEEKRKSATAELLANEDIDPHVDSSLAVAAALEKASVQKTETYSGIYKEWSVTFPPDSSARKMLFNNMPTFEDRLVETTECALLAVLDHTTPAIAETIRSIRDEDTPIDEIVRTLKPETFFEDGEWLPLRADAPPIAEDGKALLSRLFDLFSVLTPETHNIVRYALEVGMLGERVLVRLVEPHARRGRTVEGGAREGGKKGLSLLTL